MSEMSSKAPIVRTSPLHRVHAAAGASFADFGGWRIPLRYGSSADECRAVRESAGVFDLSHMGEIKVMGPGAAKALDRALVERISTVPVGRTHRTRMRVEVGAGDLVIHHVGDEEYMVVADADGHDRVVAELTRCCEAFPCTVEDISGATALIAVAGPRAVEVLKGVVESGAGMPAALHPEEETLDGAGACGPDVLCGTTILRRLRCCAAVRATAAGHSVLLARTSRTGHDGFDLFCGAEDAVDLWTVLTGRAAALPPGPRTGNGRRMVALTPCGSVAYEALCRDRS